jgi:hypothetical protein
MLVSTNVLLRRIFHVAAHSGSRSHRAALMRGRAPRRRLALPAHEGEPSHRYVASATRKPAIPQKSSPWFRAPPRRPRTGSSSPKREPHADETMPRSRLCARRSRSTRGVGSPERGSNTPTLHRRIPYPASPQPASRIPHRPNPHPALSVHSIARVVNNSAEGSMLSALTLEGARIIRVRRGRPSHWHAGCVRRARAAIGRVGAPESSAHFVRRARPASNGAAAR